MQTAWQHEPAEAGLNQADFEGGRAIVAVIIPTFNQARFLADAIESVLAQTHPADEVVVVDDGSIDDPAAVVAQFPGVRLIRQDNRGPSAARNLGLRNCNANYIVFLDADDRLLPTALESGLACLAGQPDCAFAYGGYRLMSEEGDPVGPDSVDPIRGDAHLAFVRGCPISMPSTAIFRRDCLLEINGFNETMRRAEDRDLYLRITQKYPIAFHCRAVAEYRRHDQNATNDYLAQLKAVLSLLDFHEARITADAVTRAALREGRANKRRHYADQMVHTAVAHWSAHHDVGAIVRDLVQSARWSPYFTIRSLLGVMYRRASKSLKLSSRSVS
jgi:glycosyltransferase involved in cell wall biosynthesis